VVNAFGIGSRKVANFVYDNIDQKGVDGLVNGAGAGAEAGGAELRKTQTGQVQQYAAYLFGAAALLAVGLVVLT
jgi:NADH-quinone oxidoreductase subunit L